MPTSSSSAARARPQARPQQARDHTRAAQAAPRPARRPQAQERPRLRVVDDKRLRQARRQRRVRAVLVVGCVLAAGLFFAVAACHAFLVSGQSRIDALQRQVAEEQARYSARRLDIDQLEAPERIVREANQRLGMVSPRGVTYLTPSSGTALAVGAVGVDQPTSAVSASGPGWADVKRALGTNP